ncbi:PREDICTED: T-box-containing protein TBX6L-like [Nanorana parkeri]|uniref:T-box-containing protein TBX6L-like n=1 Tax=Nanorana parkeri TaxID=125878 RepID=UPI000853FBD3|nr:PREDICTED: T-box-containing protein TBX6L-like [Nanorana parkeri]
MHNTATLGCCLTTTPDPLRRDMCANLPPSAGYYLPPQYVSSALPPPTSPQITARLENKGLWERFNSVGTEMILTKNGRRMFPEFSVSLSGLDPHRLYSLCVQAVPEGENRYKWRDGVWSRSGRAEPGPPTCLYLHPESPAPGHRWMERAVCFNKIRLTNNTLCQGGQIVLQSMHRYSLRLYVIPTSNGGSPPGPVTTFSFHETSFIAVTSYQNPRLSLLKIEENPFAKGIKYFKNQQESHTPKKRICGPEQNDRDPECKRFKESARLDPANPAGGAEESPAVLDESSEEMEEKPESLEGSGQERAETRPPGKVTSRAGEDRRRWGADRNLDCGGDRSVCESAEEGEEGGQRTDTIIQWGPPTQRATWLPPPALTPYTPSTCLMGHRFVQSGMASFSALPPVPPPYFLSSWTSPSGRLSHPHPGLHPQFFQQVCALPWYLSPHVTSR